MSVAGRNMVLGSTMTFYRSTAVPGTGGQTSISWAAVVTAAKFELHTLTAELLRQVFGVDNQVELVAFASAAANIQVKDGCVVTAGRYSGTRYRVDRTRLSRKYLEVGLKVTTEAIP